MAQSVRADKGDGCDVGSGLAGVYLKSALVGKLLIISRNWLTLGGQSLQGQQGPRYQSIRIQKIKDMANTVLFLVLHAFSDPATASSKGESISSALELGGPL